MTTYLSVQRCADLLGVSHKTIRGLIERGELRAYKVGRVLRIDPADLESLRYRPPRRAGPGNPNHRSVRAVTGTYSRRAREKG